MGINLKWIPEVIWGNRELPLDRLYQEVAYIGYHFHWTLEEILNMEHKERQLWVKEISDINKEINKSRK